MTTTRVYQRGEAIQIDAEVKDQDGNLVNPKGGVEVAVTNPSGTPKVDDKAMSNIATGKYRYFYVSVAGDEVGWWKARGISFDEVGEDTIPTITDGGFELR